MIGFASALAVTLVLVAGWTARQQRHEDACRTNPYVGLYTKTYCGPKWWR
jgi:hypothetical protein